MNRDNFKELATAHLRAAKVLLDAGHHSDSYHLAGLSIECALKACIAKLTRRHDFPDPGFAKDCFSHDLAKLRKLAGLEARFSTDVATDPALRVNWAIVKDWSVDSRYEVKSQREAYDLYSAVHRQKTGVMRWIRRYW